MKCIIHVHNCTLKGNLKLTETMEEVNKLHWNETGLADG